MAVVINEFEVVPAQPAAETRSSGEAQSAAPASPKPPDHEIERMMQHHLERSERVWAH